MYFSTTNNSVLARLFHREAREDARWEAAAVPGEISLETRRCLPIVSAYWASLLIKPNLLDLGKSDHAFLLAATCFIKLKELTPQQIRQFRANLEQKIVEEMHERFLSLSDDSHEQPTRSSVERCSLEIDYHPYGVLAEAAEEAGIDQLELRFPSKMTMRIERGEVHARQNRGDCRALYPQDKQQVKRLLRQVEQYCQGEV